ncbi:MAG: menaquinone biosynthesis protein [Bacteroidota bacterium]
MKSKIKVGAVSYLNTKPLLYGIEDSDIKDKIELSLAYPAQLAQQLKEGSIDMALMPVAALQEIEGARIVADYGIAANGNVVSVALFSQLPIEEIDTVILDYQSRTSVRLTQLLFAEYWKKEVQFVAAGPDFINEIKGNTAAVIIGDRALAQLPNFKYNYDLSAAWKAYTGLPFVFAAWVSNKDLPQDFLAEFNAANAMGLDHLDEIAEANSVPYYSLKTYYKDNICYKLGDAEKKGLDLFLQKINTAQNS